MSKSRIDRLTSTTEYNRPFLRWAGSKRQLVAKLSSYVVDSCTRYVEPFAGSACLFFYLHPSRALLGDVNKELILTYMEIKHRLPLVLEHLGQLKKGRSEYNTIRALDTNRIEKPMRAARFIYLNRFCFNGLYRTNKDGVFNVPFGGERSGDISSNTHLQACAKALQGAKLVSGDFGGVLSQVKKGDFVYMDPPYVVAAKRVFREYSGNVFSLEDLNRVRSWMERLDGMNVPFVVSYAECEEARILSRGFRSEVIYVKRSIAGSTFHRRHSSERVISNI